VTIGANNGRIAGAQVMSREDRNSTRHLQKWKLRVSLQTWQSMRRSILASEDLMSQTARSRLNFCAFYEEAGIYGNLRIASF